MAKLIYRDGTREIWETEEGGKTIFVVITPFGTFICPTEAKARYELDRQGLLVIKKGGKWDGIRRETQREGKGSFA